MGRDRLRGDIAPDVNDGEASAWGERVVCLFGRNERLSLVEHRAQGVVTAGRLGELLQPLRSAPQGVVPMGDRGRALYLLPAAKPSLAVLARG